MRARDCRRKAEEFLRAADSNRDDLSARRGWVFLAEVWLSLAEKFDQQAASKNRSRMAVRRDDRPQPVEQNRNTTFA
jgi:hypothetical protein